MLDVLRLLLLIIEWLSIVNVFGYEKIGECHNIFERAVAGDTALLWRNLIQGDNEVYCLAYVKEINRKLQIKDLQQECKRLLGLNSLSIGNSKEYETLNEILLDTSTTVNKVHILTVDSGSYFPDGRDTEYLLSAENGIVSNSSDRCFVISGNPTSKIPNMKRISCEEETSEILCRKSGEDEEEVLKQYKIIGDCPQYPYTIFDSVPKMILNMANNKGYCIYPHSLLNVNILSNWQFNFNAAEEFCSTTYQGHLVSFQNAQEQIILHRAVFPKHGQLDRQKCYAVGLKLITHKYGIFTDKTDSIYANQRAEYTVKVEEEDEGQICFGICRVSETRIDKFVASKCANFNRFLCKSEVPFTPQEVHELIIEQKRQNIFDDDKSRHEYRKLIRGFLYADYEFYLHCFGVSGVCEPKKSSDFFYNYDPALIYDAKTEIAYCIHDITLYGQELRGFYNIKNYCKRHFSGDLLSIANAEENTIINGKLYLEDDLLFPHFNLSKVTFQEPPGVLIGLKYISGQRFIFNNNVDASYALAQAFSDRFAFDTNGSCFSTVRIPESNRDTIWKTSCDLLTTRIACQTSPLNIDRSKKPTRLPILAVTSSQDKILKLLPRNLTKSFGYIEVYNAPRNLIIIAAFFTLSFGICMVAYIALVLVEVSNIAETKLTSSNEIHSSWSEMSDEAKRLGLIQEITPNTSLASGSSAVLNDLQCKKEEVDDFVDFAECENVETQQDVSAMAIVIKKRSEVSHELQYLVEETPKVKNEDQQDSGANKIGLMYGTCQLLTEEEAKKLINQALDILNERFKQRKTIVGNDANGSSLIKLAVSGEPADVNGIPK